MTDTREIDTDYMLDQACKQALSFIKGGNPDLAQRHISTSLGVAEFVEANA